MFKFRGLLEIFDKITRILIFDFGAFCPFKRAIKSEPYRIIGGSCRIIGSSGDLAGSSGDHAGSCRIMHNICGLSSRIMNDYDHEW